jgi:signal transduction histidine kinase
MALSLEEGQRELERKNKELLIKNQELEAAKEQLEDHLQQKIFTEKLSGVADLAMGLVDEINSPVAHVVSNVQRLQDYFSRAQQLITLLVGQGRNDPQVREAMRRVDWEFVRSEFPHVAEESLKGVSRIREIVKDLTVLADSKTIADGDMEDVDLNLVVEKAVKVVRSQAPMGVKIDHHLFLDRKIPVFPQRIEQALVHIITYAAHSIEGEGSVRVVARPHGGKVEVEISDTGSGMDADTIARVFLPFSSNQVPMGGSSLGLSLAHSIVKMHKGNIRVLSQVGRGSTFVIDLPTEVLN